MSLQLLPAVDVAEGQAVRLVQGAAGSETRYGSPLAAALEWQSAGAEWVHLVDLDAAFGRGDNRALLAEVVGRLDVAVELSGGIRDDETLAAALATGCTRVNLGTAALEDPAWCASAIARHGDQVAVGLDVQVVDGVHRLKARGWVSDGGELFETLARLDADGCSRYVVTDVSKDGTLTGPNLELLSAVCAVTDAPGRRLRRGVHDRRPRGHRGARRPGGWRARSSARRSTRGGSRCRRRSPRCAGEPRPARAARRGHRSAGRRGAEVHRRAGRPQRGGEGPGRLRDRGRPGAGAAAHRRADRAHRHRGARRGVRGPARRHRHRVGARPRRRHRQLLRRAAAVRHPAGAAARGSAGDRPDLAAAAGPAHRRHRRRAAAGRRRGGRSAGPVHARRVDGVHRLADPQRRRPLPRVLPAADHGGGSPTPCLRVRLLGATGVDLAWTATGALGGSVTFGHHAWDNAAGVCLVRAAGGVVSDLAGQPWDVRSPSVLAGAPGVHAELLELVAGLGDPQDTPQVLS